MPGIRKIPILMRIRLELNRNNPCRLYGLMEFFRQSLKQALILSLTGTCALANLQIGFSFQPELLAGTDDQQLVGSTWTLSINVSQSNYGDLQGSNLPYASPDSVQLTISGSGISNNNGTFDLTPSDPENVAVAPTNGTYAYAHAPCIGVFPFCRKIRTIYSTESTFLSNSFNHEKK